MNLETELYKYQLLDQQRKVIVFLFAYEKKSKPLHGYKAKITIKLNINMYHIYFPEISMGCGVWSIFSGQWVSGRRWAGLLNNDESWVYKCCLL